MKFADDDVQEDERSQVVAERYARYDSEDSTMVVAAHLIFFIWRSHLKRLRTFLCPSLTVRKCG